MQRGNCFGCGRTANFSCKTGHARADFCILHVGEHGTHAYKVLDSRVPVDANLKKSLLSKILEIKTESTRIAKEVARSTEAFMRDLLNYSKSTLVQVNKTIAVCDYYIEQLGNLKDLSAKRYFPPLESCLLSDSLIISSLLPPTLATLDSSPFFQFASSNISALLNHFVNFSVLFPSESEIIISPRNLPRKIAKKDWTSSAFPVSPTEFLLTGGKNSYNSAIVVNISNSEIKKLPSFNIGRKLHATGWIEGHLAVIGGVLKGDEEITSSVEVLGNEYWSEIAPLNHERAKCTVSNAERFTFVFGGWDGERIADIERYDRGNWEDLHVKLEIPCSSPAVLCQDKEFLVFGGMIGNGKALSSCNKIDFAGRYIRRQAQILKPGSSIHNIWTLENQILNSTLKDETHAFFKIQV